jgi:hypothetical protein
MKILFLKFIKRELLEKKPTLLKNDAYRNFTLNAPSNPTLLITSAGRAA